ncbi:MAG: GNAT family N-acetyltransferase [Rhodobacteraceae bacterium]|nr:GNAT family N-acetyltransferase [Paracoccaceae bacterium]
MTALRITPGFSEVERPLAARLYWQAFKGKLGPVMKPTPRALAFFETILDPRFALAARDETGKLLGLAGFKTAEGALTGGGIRDLARAYGWVGGLWRGAILSVLERDLAPDTLLMDGIFVAQEARGRGVGTALLDAIKAEAHARGLSSVRLDVIDTNPRARALYERAGFTPTGVEKTGPLRHVFGFATSTTMLYPLP